MVELKEVLHVPEDDVLLVDDPWRDLLHSTGHLPQIGLGGDEGGRKEGWREGWNREGEDMLRKEQRSVSIGVSIEREFDI